MACKEFPMRWTALFCLPSLALALAAAPPRPLPLANAGFESDLEGWKATGPGAVEALPGLGQGGSKALRVRQGAFGQTTVAGPAVKLQVGRLYRLSAWAKAEGVTVDPAARYPTALGACLSMASFPFTNASPTVTAEGNGRLEVTFFATSAQDRVQLHLGRNGGAAGTVHFDDVRLEEVDITEHIPLAKVRWEGPAFRYEEGGWIFVHVEGEPFARGYQHGRLLAEELAAYLDKLAIQQDKVNPEKGWDHLRTMADALMLRKFDPEYLEEMKGIAAGVAKAGVTWKGRKLDLLDIATLNSAIDFSALEDGLRVAPTPLSGRSFLKAEEEMEKAGKGDHCSAFVATKSATPDGRFVTGQMFMWGGYTGVHWNVMLDIAPAKGNRVVMQTFPGGIHSGADWYVTGGGLVIGETTVGQTPFNPDGTPQSNRIRKAAQYARSIDDVARILSERNNGLYTNDWVIADTKTDEGAIFLLGTQKTRLWRTGSKGKAADTPGNLKDFVWANNNNRDPDVRRETAANPDNAPVDLAFNTWNRDITFWNWFKNAQGRIDLAEAVRFWATSPVQRPHACDGKLTTAEMAEQLMFIAHQGKTTHREKWVGGRYIADLPGAVPHLTYGYTTFSPRFVTEALQAARAAQAPAPAEPKADLAAVKEAFAYPAKGLWENTVFPATDAENWFSSGSAAYHTLLRRMPSDPARALTFQRDALADLNARYAFFAQREPETAPLATSTDYSRYSAYQHPRIKGTFALHQLRLWLGNETFAKALKAVHEAHAGKAATTEAILATASAAAGRDVRPLVKPWLERTGLPDPKLEAAVAPKHNAFEVSLTVRQTGTPWPFVAQVALETPKGRRFERIEVTGAETTARFTLPERPTALHFNAGADVPVASVVPVTLPNLLDAWEDLLFVRGTGRFQESHHSLALRFQEAVADAFTDVVLPLKADGAVIEADLAHHDLVLLGRPEENAVVARLAAQGALPVAFVPGGFQVNGVTHAREDEGVAFAVPSPWNPKRMVHVYAANSPLQLWRMTKALQRGLPAWAVWRGDRITTRGHHPVPGFTVKLP